MSSSPATQKVYSSQWPLWCLALAVALLFLSRLPFLLRMELALDGDESIVGLMALHLLQGRSLPVFFYGQGYGLSILEAGAGATVFAVLGVSATALRLAMVALWSLGGAFLGAAAAQLAGRRAGWITSLLVATCPAWLEWSTKARGGYVTAFLLSSLALWMVSEARPGGPSRHLGVGMCVAGVFFAQPFWLAGLLPFLIALWWRRRDTKEGSFLLAGALGGSLILQAAAAGADYWRPDLLGDFQPLTSLLGLPMRVHTLFTGAYLYEERLTAGFFSVAAGMIWTLAALFLLLLPMIRRRGGARGPALAGAVAVLLLIALSLLVSPAAFGFRYLLPLALVVPLVSGLGTERRGRFHATVIMVGLLAISGGLALGERTWKPLAAQRLSPYTLLADEEAALLQRLERAGVHHVYSLDPLLPWNLAFASGEAVQGRWFAADDRVPAYPRAVDHALAAGQPVALVGRNFQLPHLLQSARQAGLPAPRTEQATDAIFVVWEIDEQLLRASGFEFRRVLP